MPTEWTLDELVARVSAALGAADYPGAPNGRVREVPDRRAIRWYTTIGLLDRPGRRCAGAPRCTGRVIWPSSSRSSGGRRRGAASPRSRPSWSGATDADADGIAGVDGTRTPAQTRRHRRRTGVLGRAGQRRPAPAPPVHERPTADVLTGVPLDGWRGAAAARRAPDPDDLAALRAAAAPLIDLLAARGLLHGPTT